MRAGAALLVVTVLFACGGTAPAITPATKVSPTPATTPTPSPSATPTISTVPVTQLLTKCPAPRAFSSLTRFASVASAREIDVASDGSVWVSTGSRGVIAHLSSTGAAMASYNEQSPTGVVAMPNGNVLFADQSADRVLELNTATLAISTFLQLTPHAGQPNIEGLGIDSSDALLLVPDTAQGQLELVPLAGGEAKVLATGIAQPVDAAVGPGSVIEVSSSSLVPGLLSIPQAGGAATSYKTVLLHLGAVVVSGLLIYFTAPPSKRVYAFNPATGHTAVLVTAIPDPLGLGLLGNGELVVSDATSGTLASFHAC